MKTTTAKSANRLAEAGLIEKHTNGTNRIQEAVELPAMKMENVEIHVVGRSPLIVHNWSAKAIRQMLDKQMKTAAKGRDKKDPFDDFKSSLYPVVGTDNFGIPAPSFKACAVSAANAVELKMTQMRQAFHVAHYVVPVFGVPLTDEQLTEWDREYIKDMKPYHAKGISMRMDVVRLESGVADLRFRAWYPKWSAVLEVEYNPTMISLAQLVNLFRAGGLGCGVGEWRPSSPQCRSGEYGRFDIK